MPEPIALDPRIPDEARPLPVEHVNRLDAEGRPAGGFARLTLEGDESPCIFVRWQDGPLNRVGSPERLAPNGAFVEQLIQIALERIEFYNDNGFSCVENIAAVSSLRGVLMVLNERTARRVAQQVEGTHEGH